MDQDNDLIITTTIIIMTIWRRHANMQSRLYRYITRRIIMTCLKMLVSKYTRLNQSGITCAMIETSTSALQPVLELM